MAYKAANTQKSLTPIVVTAQPLHLSDPNETKPMKTLRIRFRTALLAVAVLLISSCATPDKIAYFQDLEPGEQELILMTSEGIKVRPADKISILVNSRDAQLTDLFNLPIVSRQLGTTSTNMYRSTQNQGLSGYTVDPEGMIDFPVLGRIKVAGMNRTEIAAHIKSLLVSNNLVKDPVVTVEYMSLGISVLGEVKNPGRYSIDREKVTILDAISMAGDLTIYGKRENVYVLRQEGDTQHAYSVDLCSAQDLYSSPVYYMQQDDVVYVEPNDVRARQSTVNGNNVRSTSFWFSLGSLLISLAILIVD